MAKVMVTRVIGQRNVKVAVATEEHLQALLWTKYANVNRKIADPVVAKILIACLEILRLVAVPMITARFV